MNESEFIKFVKLNYVYNYMAFITPFQMSRFVIHVNQDFKVYKPQGYIFIEKEIVPSFEICYHSL